MFCQEWAAVKREHPGITVVPLRCKCWHCDECRPLRTARLIAEAKSGQPNKFITLTSRRTPGGDPSLAAQAMVRAWRTIRAEYLKTRDPGALPFLAVFEETKAGWPHLHIVARCGWIAQRWLSKRMKELTDSPYVWIEAADSAAKVAYYITKYIGKNPHRFDGVKRYWRSLDYLLTPVESEPDEPDLSGPWCIVKMDWLSYIRQGEALGFTATMERGQAFLEWSGWKG